MRIYRSCPILRADEKDRTISGKAICFNSWSKDLGGFVELIHPEAITQELIDAADIVMNYNHDDEKMLARWRQGEGTLHLELKDDGLYFSFECPDTALGNEVLYNVRSGNLFECSFAFSMPDEEDAEHWDMNESGIYERHIYKIADVYDCAICPHGAYGDTYCRDLKYRGIDVERIDLEQVKRNIAKRNMTEQEYLDKIAELQAQIDALKTQEEQKEGETPDEEEKPEEKPADEEQKEEEETPVENPADEEEKEEENPADEEKPAEKEVKKYKNRNIMNLTKQFRKAYQGQPVEFRAVDTIGTSGNTVKTDVENILAPIYAESLIGALGMTVYSGLTNQKRFPILGKPTAAWMGEQGSITATDVAVGAQYLEPHILKVMIPVSHTLLVEDDVNFEGVLKDAMVNALKNKLEKTIFSTDAEGANGASPAGILADVTPGTTISTFADVIALEQGLEDKDYANFKYAVAPSVKAKLRSTIKGTNATGMVWENNEIDGTEAHSNSVVQANACVVGDFSTVAVGLWDTVRVEMINDSTLAGSDQVMFCVTMYADVVKTRQDAIAYATI